MLSAQNTRLDHLGADIRPAQPEPATPALPALSCIGVLDLARLFHADRPTALALAESNAADHWADIAKAVR
jgi:hypothetical protein